MSYDSAYTPATMWNNWTTAPFTLYTAPSQSATTSTREAYRNDLYTINVFATYDKTFAKDHNLKVMVGGTAERERYDDFYVRRSVSSTIRCLTSTSPTAPHTPLPPKRETAPQQASSAV